MAKNNETRFFYVLYSDKTWVFDQSEGAKGPIIKLTNKEASKRKKCRGKHETQSSAAFPHFLSALPLPKCFTTDSSRAQSRLLYLFHDKESNHFPIRLNFQTKPFFQRSKSGVRRALFSVKAC